MPGRPPFGYKRMPDGLIIDRVKLPIIRSFFDHFLLYGSLRSAVRSIKHKYGTTIAVTTGKQWLINPVYRGDTTQGEKILRDTHAPILSREEGAQIDRLLRRNRGFSPRSASCPRSLSGLVKCAICNHKFTIVAVKDYLYLRCPECPQVNKCKGLNYQDILDRIFREISQQLVEILSALPREQMTNLRANFDDQIKQKLQLLNQIPGLLIHGIFDDETAKLRILNLNTEIAQLQQQLSQLPPMDLAVIAPTLARLEFWQDLSEVERRRYFREFIAMIEFMPPDRLEIKFIPRSAPVATGANSGQLLPASQ